MASNWWDSPNMGGSYNKWWEQLQTAGIDQNPDFTGGMYDPASSPGKFWEGLVDPAGIGGKYGAMSPYQYKAVGDRSNDLYNNFLMETLGNMGNTDNNFGNVIRAEDYAKYLKQRIGPYGYDSGSGLGVPGQNTAGAHLAAGYQYSTAQSQAMLRQALQNMTTSYQSASDRTNEWTGYKDTYSNATSKLNTAYNDALTALNKLYDDAGVPKIANNGFNQTNLRTLLTTGRLVATYKDTQGVTKPVGSIGAGATDFYGGNALTDQYKALFLALAPVGSALSAPDPGIKLDLTRLTPGVAGAHDIGLVSDSIGKLAGNPGGLATAFSKALLAAQKAVPGYTLTATDRLNLLKAIAAGDQSYVGNTNAWKLNSVQNAAQTLVQEGTTGSGSNKLYDMLWSGLGAGYGGIMNNALKSQFQRRVDAMRGSQAGSGGLNFLEQLANLFNQYAARSGQPSAGQGIAPTTPTGGSGGGYSPIVFPT